MANFSLHAYDADVWVQEFKGLNQAAISMNQDIRYAVTATNVETPNGVLQPQAAPETLPGAFDSRVETLACFHRRWYQGTGSKDWYVCCVDGKFYQKQAGTSQPWDEIAMPSGVSAFQSSTWSWVTYETHPEDDEETDTVDVLLLSNAEDGMIMIVPPDRPNTWRDVQEHTWNWVHDMTWMEVISPQWNIQQITECPYKFGVIERYAERIWGGAITENPDRLVYSAPYDPTDWDENPDIPEDGAGEVDQPTWDGDKFYALKRFGDQLLAFKKNTVWRVIGTSPGEYTFSEQYGGGTSFFNTIAVENERVFMESVNGLCVYDGMSTSPYLQESVRDIWKTVNRNALSQMCAAIFRDKYYVAFPTGDSETNNAMLVYNMKEGTILFYDDFHVESFLRTDDELFYTSSVTPGTVSIMRYDSWDTGNAIGKATRWVSPWIDFGYKSIQKGGFEIYFVPEVQDKAVTLRFSVQTEKKTKTKEYTIQPLTAEQKRAGKEIRGKRLHFGGNGRRFRVMIETSAGVTAPWRLIGGLQMIVETDPD